MSRLTLPKGLEQFRDRFEATVKPYVEIQAHPTREATLWQSKFAGFPYLPKGFDYPKTPEGDYLYLLAQINFREVPRLEGFPEKGILQFYIAGNNLYGCNYEDRMSQTGFRVLYFPDSDLNEDNLITNFDFLPNLWDIEFTPFSIYTQDRNECFALTFNQQSAPITTCDYKFDELIGRDVCDALVNDVDLDDEYYDMYPVGHKLGGYPNFVQEDPRQVLPEDMEPYLLLLQIDTDIKSAEEIGIQWGDNGTCNFFIKDSALRRLNFSDIVYDWAGG
jgi:uncharacterized protein YwqG